MSRALFTSIALAAAFAPAIARASCADRPTARWVLHHTLLGVVEPLGAEHQLRLGICLPLRPSDDPVLALNHVELGALSYASPTYAYSGAYVQLTPLTIVTLRLEISQLSVWPFPLNGAGHFGLESATSPRRSEDLPQARAETALGWNVRGLAILRGRVELAPDLGIVALDAIWLDRAVLGGAPYYLNLQLDHVAGRADTALGNEAVLALEVAIAGGPTMRFGAYDALRRVDRSGALGHQLGAIAMAVWSRPIPEIASLELLVRGGAYTDHPIRVGPALLGWCSITWDLGGV